jgi:hypothetical protein
MTFLRQPRVGSISAFHHSEDRTHPLRPSFAAIALLAATSAHAQDGRFLESLRRVEPTTRLEQVCDLEAMNRIKRDTGMNADRAKSDVISSPHHNGHTLTANGGAFRASARWFELSFVCKGSRDHQHVIAFKYKIGKPIPESKWSSLGLWR